MTQHYDEGALRAYRDEQLPADEQAEIAAHLADCADCQTRLADLSALTRAVSGYLDSEPAA